jgi:hypothetical protein
MQINVNLQTYATWQCLDKLCKMDSVLLPSLLLIVLASIPSTLPFSFQFKEL